MFVEYMNTKLPNITFTFEYGHNNYFSFLNVKICRENNKFFCIFSVYRKPKFSGFLTNFKIFMPTVYKFSLVYTLLYLCFKLLPAINS